MKSKKILKTIVLILSILMCIVISGCQRKYDVEIDVLEGRFITPSGEFVVDVLSELSDGVGEGSRKNIPSKASFYLLHGNDGDTFVYFGVLRNYDTLKITSLNSLYESGFELDSINYEYNEKESPFNFSVNEFIYQESALISSRFIEKELPTPLANIRSNGVGGSLSKANIKEIRENKNNIHRIVMVFYLNGSKYTFDVSFRLALRGHWDVGVPGGAP